MSSSVRVALLFPFLLAAAGMARADDQSPTPADPAVQAKLDARGFHYEVDADGDYKLIYSFEKEQRTQILFVGGRTEELGGMKVREVFSPAARLKDGITGEVALELLADNRAKKLGAWEINGEILYFVAKLSEDIGAEDLETAMDLVASLADDLEMRFSGDRDEL